LISAYLSRVETYLEYGLGVAVEVGLDTVLEVVRLARYDREEVLRMEYEVIVPFSKWLRFLIFRTRSGSEPMPKRAVIPYWRLAQSLSLVKVKQQLIYTMCQRRVKMGFLPARNIKYHIQES
jgi:hypothetical protein